MLRRGVKEGLPDHLVEGCVPETTPGSSTKESGPPCPGELLILAVLQRTFPGQTDR